MTKNTWIEELKDFEMILEDGTLKDCLVYHEAIKQFVIELLAKNTEEIIYCKKTVENDKTICGQKLDCHLHNWRQNDMKKIWQDETRKKMIEEIKDILPDEKEIFCGLDLIEKSKNVIANLHNLGFNNFRKELLKKLNNL